LLSEAGWLVLRFWEHEDPNEIADAIASAVEGRRPRGD
jgi:DNA mismatch endonuclease (patch repair protein)